MNPIYSRGSRLVKSRKGLSTSCCEGFPKTSKRRQKVQKGGWIGPEVSKPVGYDWDHILARRQRRRRRNIWQIPWWTVACYIRVPNQSWILNWTYSPFHSLISACPVIALYPFRPTRQASTPWNSKWSSRRLCGSQSKFLWDWVGIQTGEWW